MEELLGKTIRKVYINEDQSLIAFDTTDEMVYFATEGDCCSETWFSDVLNITNILNEQVTGVKELELLDYDVEDGRTRQEYDRVYGYEVMSRKGESTFIFRNSSNGYYGGGIMFCPAARASEEFSNEFSEITVDDWKA